MKHRSIDEIKAVLDNHSHKFFENGDFNINIIAIREDDVYDNTFSDTCNLIYKEHGVWKNECFKWTTLAGVFGHGGEKSPLKSWETGTAEDGLACIAEGQYRGAFQYIKNGWRYPFQEYLSQIKGIDYLPRDNDKNGTVLRAGKIHKNTIWQTHLHAMSQFGQDGHFVSYPNYSPWSQGCQGTPYTEFQKFLMPIKKSVKLWGDKFTYTLVHAKDF